MTIYKKGDRIAQLVITKRDDSNMVEGIVGTDTARSTGGFGSSGTA
jgi:dUTPase